MRFSILTLALLLTACGEPDKPDDTAPDDTATIPPDDTAAEPSDADGDGYSSDRDCDDDDADVHPDADELCNGMDDDCDGDVDEDAIDASTWYTDADADGWGDPDSPVQACEQPNDTVADNTDCDDADASSNPGAEEICDDRADNDCDGAADEACAPPDDYPLADADAVLYGTSEGGTAGYAVSSAGDINADGYDDLIVGAPDAIWEGDELDGVYEAGVRTGAAMIVLGPVSGALDLDTADAWIQGSVIEGDDNSVDAGWTVAGVGDTNGDGFDDVLIGDPLSYRDTGLSTLNYAGMAGLFLGPVVGVDDLWSADAFWNTGCYCAWTGYDVAGADVNGDGLADILVGSPFGCAAGTDGGEVLVMEGPLMGDLGDADITATLYSDSLYDQAGSAVSSAGDVDGDGLDDILVGAYNDSSVAERAGVAYLVQSPVRGMFSLSDSELIIHGESAYLELGRALGSAGDLDGDGYDDEVIGARYYSVTKQSAGAAVVFYGSTHGVIGDTTLENADAILTGTMEYERAADSVACAGDTDGDGRSDLLINRDLYYADHETAGTSWLVHGPIYGTWALDEVASTRFTGPSEGDQAGFSLSSAGDVDADGLSDILIGAPGDDTHGEDAGAAYLVLAAGL